MSDPDFFDDLYDTALGAALAFKLVTPLSGNVGMKMAYKAAATEALEIARSADANESIPKLDHVPDWIQTRGVGSAFGYGDFMNPVQWGQWYTGYEEFNWSS